MLKRVFIILICCFTVNTLLSQQDSTIVQHDNSLLDLKEISKEDLQTYKENPDFDYEIAKSDTIWWNDITTWLGNLTTRFFEWIFGVEKAAGFMSSFLRIIPYLLMAFLLFILIKFFLNVNATGLVHSKTNNAIVALSEEEHIIKNEDIDQLIQNALKENNHRLAIRYYYLLILRQLSDKKLIDWQLQKTNDDYINELQKEEIKNPFSHITLLYDYIWYGNFAIDEAKFRKAESKFISLKKHLADHG